MADKLQIALNLLVALTSIAICIKFFLRNHTFKKWLRIYEAGVIGIWAVVYILILVGILTTRTYQDILRPIAPVLLLIPALECISDWWRYGNR